MSKKITLSDVNNSLMKRMLEADPQAQLKRSLKTGQQIVLHYPLSKDVKKQITGHIIRRINKNFPYAAIEVICGDNEANRICKIIKLYNSVEINKVFPLKRAKRANLGYLAHTTKSISKALRG